MTAAEAVEAVQRANSYAATGMLASRGSSGLERLIAEHLAIVQRMERELPARTRSVGRLLVEGYSSREMARELGASVRTIARDREAFKDWLLGVGRA